MSRYYALVLVPGETPEDEACDAALELLYPYMHTERGEPTKVFKFDYMYSPEDIANLTDDDITDHMWRVSEILEPNTLAGLEVEALLTPDGTWYEPDDPGQLWDDPAWLKKAKHVLEHHRECLALRHVLHV